MVRALESSDGGDDERIGSAALRDRRTAADPTPGIAGDDGLLTHARFVALIDRCVRHLAAGLRDATADRDPSDTRAADAARIQLWRWLHEGGATLDDGTPIGFALFDQALQRANERLPRRGARGCEHITRAAWLLAELTHAPTLADGFIAVAPLSSAASLSRYPADAATD